MSKKLIAVASAAALALSALVVMPAQAAATWTVTVTDGFGDDWTTSAATSRTPAEHEALETNQVDPDLGLVEFSIEPSASSSITVTASGSVRLVVEGEEEADEDADTEFITLNQGKTSLPAKTLTASSDDYVFYAYSTSSTAGKVEIKDASGNVQNYFVASEAGSAYNIAATFPAAVPVKVGGADLYVKITDVFGNEIKGDETGDPFSSIGGETLTATLVGAEFAATESNEVTDWIWNKTKKLWTPDSGDTADGVAEKDQLVSAAAGPVVISLSLDSESNDVGFADPKNVAFKVLDSASLEDQIVRLEAKVAKMVTKKRFNTLARKWNRAFPSQKVALKK